MTFAVASVGVGAALSGFVLPSYLPEAFPIADRATGVGLTYGVGSGVFGGVAPLLAGWLLAQHRLPTIALYPVLCAVAAALCVAWSVRSPDPATVPGELRAGAEAAGSNPAPGSGASITPCSGGVNATRTSGQRRSTEFSPCAEGTGARPTMPKMLPGPGVLRHLAVLTRPFLDTGEEHASPEGICPLARRTCCDTNGAGTGAL